jgi:hypothetical protein
MPLTSEESDNACAPGDGFDGFDGFSLKSAFTLVFEKRSEASIAVQAVHWLAVKRSIRPAPIPTFPTA